MPLLLAALALTLLTGCYRYSPVSGAPPPGARVAARLGEAGTAKLTSLLGPSVAEVEGRVLGVTPDELTISVLVVRSHSGIETDWRGERIMVPRADIVSLRERTLSRGRSILSAGTLVVATMAAAGILSGGEGGAGGGRGGGPGRN